MLAEAGFSGIWRGSLFRFSSSGGWCWHGRWVPLVPSPKSQMTFLGWSPVYQSLGVRLRRGRELDVEKVGRK